MEAGARRALEVRGGSDLPSENEGGGDVVVVVFAMVLDFVLPVFSKVVDADTICFAIHDVEELASEFDELGRVDEAFEDRCLNPLTIVETGFGDSAESILSGRGSCRDVVGDEDVHGGRILGYEVIGLFC